MGKGYNFQVHWVRLIGLFIAVLSSLHSFATHIRAGEVIATRVSDRNYLFTFFGYRDVEGVPFGQGRFDFGDGEIWGDEDGENIPWNPNIVNLGNGVERWEFTIPHTYDGDGIYLVSYEEDFRNEGILNMENSVSTAFYVETLIRIDELFPNNSPYFTIPPIDQGVVGAPFEHNPGAIDVDGDSLAFYFTIPKQSRGLRVNGHRELTDPSFYEVFEQGNSTQDAFPTLSIDEFGTIVWDSPGGALIPPNENGEYNVAFVVEEFRKINGRPVSIGYVTRDMQIIIWNYENEPPELELPPDTCVIAGDVAVGIVTGSDPDGDAVMLEAFGEPFEVNPAASYVPFPPEFQALPATLNFQWETDCGLVRVEPYEVQYKATDDPGPILDQNGNIIVQNPAGLVNFETWQITITGPAPTGLSVESRPGRSMQLNWDDYTCTEADEMQVWRRVDEFEINPDCDQGMPENTGYELIETLDIRSTSFLDQNQGDGLAAGSKYCYRLVAVFPNGSESIVSEEACDSLAINVPVITNVDIETTDTETGRIIVRWTPPYDIDTALYPPNYNYELMRSTDRLNFVSLVNAGDTSFVDTNLNTFENQYYYKVRLYDATNFLVDSSQIASSVRLQSRSRVNAVDLEWQADVPWSNISQEFPYHYIYRDRVEVNNPELLVLIDSVDVTIGGQAYFDNGAFNDEVLDDELEYCYFIDTKGTYGIDQLPEPLINSSQIMCAQPGDSIAPCTPIQATFAEGSLCENQIALLPCGSTELYTNLIEWDEDVDQLCDDDTEIYRVYYSSTGIEGSYELIEETTSAFFSHDNLTSLAGCYRISAVDRSGNESDPTAPICNDNCPQYGLPNVFTPNGDEFNDTFRPFKDQANGCPRFVESVQFKAFNRAGLEVFDFDSGESESTIFINWDGTNKEGQELPAGVYFYEANIRYNVLDTTQNNETISGWVQLIR